MGVLVYILGKSGTGKSYSMRNFPKDKFALVNVQGKILPFKGSGSIESVSTDKSDDIVDALNKYAKKYNSIVVDDYQYTMANEFMRRSTERGYDKFTEIARHAWDIANAVRNLPNNIIVYIMCHTAIDEDGSEKIKTIGKMLDEKICLEGMSTIVLKTNVSDGAYTFVTQNSGKDTVKSPAGMFPSYAIDNDLYYVDQKIRNYYELGEFVGDDEIQKMDEVAKNDDVQPKRRGRSRGETKVEETKVEEQKVEEQKDELPKRKSRTPDEVDLPFDIPDTTGAFSEAYAIDQGLPAIDEPAPIEPEQPRKSRRRRKEEE